MKQKQEQPLAQTIWTVSNGLSLFRLLLTIPVVLLLRYPYTNRWAILGIGLLAYASDLADGYFARRFHQETKAGRVIDPLADKIIVAGVLLSMLMSGLVPLWYVVCVLARDIFILIAGVIVTARTRLVLPSNMTGKIAVASIAAVMVALLFEDVLSSVTMTLLMFLSLALLLISLIKYTERFFSVMKKQRN